MPRRIPAGRFDDLVRRSTEVFIARGWRRTQMADIAQAVGVSKPALYLYVESKEALFSLCCQYADHAGMLALPDELPVPAPPPGSAVQSLAKQLEREAALPQMSAAIGRARADDIEVELRSIVDEFYGVIERSCRTLKLLDRCWDHPEFGPAWQEQGRIAPRVRLAEYFDVRIRAGQLPGRAEPRLLARIALETVTTWAMHIRWDREPEDFDLVESRRVVVDFIVRGLLQDRPASQRPVPAKGTPS
jgi:AcrR family transcriptional regulator